MLVDLFIKYDVKDLILVMYEKCFIGRGKIDFDDFYVSKGISP